VGNRKRTGLRGVRTGRENQNQWRQGEVVELGHGCERKPRGNARFRGKAKKEKKLGRLCRGSG